MLLAVDLWRGAAASGPRGRAAPGASLMPAGECRAEPATALYRVTFHSTWSGEADPERFPVRPRTSAT